MSLQDDLDAAVELDGEGRLLPVAVEAQRTLRTDALRALISDVSERTFTVPGDLAVVVSDMRVPQRGSGDALCFHLVAYGAGGAMLHEDDHVVFNPPVTVQVGEEPNPNHDPQNPLSPATRPLVEIDARKAFRAIVANILQTALGE